MSTSETVVAGDYSSDGIVQKTLALSAETSATSLFVAIRIDGSATYASDVKLKLGIKQN